MEYRHLGRSGLKVSALSFGAWVTAGQQVDEKVFGECMTAARESGVNFFDNAEIYAGGRAETVMGNIIKKSGWRRSSILISTKFYWGINEGPNEENSLNRKRLLEGIDGSLKRLQLDYVDLVYCHRADPTTPIEETVWAMHDIIERGKALYWGTSEWSAAEIVAAIEVAERHHLRKPVMEQTQYNMLHRERFEMEYARLFRDYGYGATTWSPLGSGMLTGKYIDGIPNDSRGALKGYEWLRPRLTEQESIARVKTLQPVAKELGCSLAQMALAWCLKNPNVSTVITGASRVEQVRENMKALEVVKKLSDDVMKRIDDVLGNKPKMDVD
jgi:voltage-dependent potassium channel beta subunit